MFYVCGPSILADDEVRGVWLPCVCYVVGVGGFIVIVYVVQVEEIGDFHLLVGAQHFVLDRDGLFRPCVYYLALEVLQVASHGGVVRFGDIVEERVEVVPFVWRVEIGCEEHDELVHYAFVLHHGAAEVIADDKVQPGIVYDVQLLLRGVHMDYGVSGGMECGYGAWYPQGALNFFL